MSRRIGRRGALVAAVLAPLLLTGCGGEPAAGEPVAAAAAAAEHNAGDVMFLQMMIAHQRKGLELAGLAADRAQREDVRMLAAAVEATESAEVKRMTSWLKGWGKPTTAAPSAHHHAHHGAEPAIGAKEVEALKKAKGDAFETTFLNLFIAHQHNSVEMAQTALEKGVNPDAKAYAERVKESRTDQIQQMLGMLKG